MLKNQNFYKNKFYKMAIFNCFKNKKNLFLTFLPKNIWIKKQNMCSPCLCGSNKKQIYDIFIISEDIAIWVNPHGTPILTLYSVYGGFYSGFYYKIVACKGYIINNYFVNVILYD